MRSISASLETGGVQAPSHNPRVWNLSFNFRTIVAGACVFVGYYLGARIGFALTFQPHPVSVLWPPNSILVAALLLTPPRIWWFVLLAAFPAHCAAQLQSHVPRLMILGWFISNSCEAVIGAGLTRYLIGGPIRFASLRNTGTFCLCVVFIGPFLSSFLDAAFVVWNNWGQDTYWELIRIRLFSNALAALIVVPLVVTWATNGIQTLRTAPLARHLEACALFLGLLAVSYAVLYKFGSGVDSALLFLPLPFLLWAAVRFGSLGASSAISIVGFLAIWSASHGHGPFCGGTAEQNALSIHIFLIALAIPLLFLATVIEERATGETKLRESESRFRIVADAAPVLIWMSGIDKLRTFSNKPWLEFTGRRMEQELGNGWAEAVHPEDLQTCLKVYTEAFDARKSFIMQYRLRRNDGEYRWVSDQGVARYDEQGKFAGYIGTALDVTELINKDAALRESEERMRLAADAVNLGIWELDLSTEEIWATNSRRPLLGWPASGKVTFEDFISAVHPDDRDRIRQMIDQAIEEGKDYECEYRLILPDGIVRWMAMRGSAHFDENGKPERLLGISIEITDQKLVETANRDLAHASRVASLGELTALIAHEINQPLGAILSNADAAELLLESESPPLDEVRKILADIRSDDIRAGEIIRHIRLLTGKRVVQMESLNINDIAAEVVRFMEVEAHRRSVSLHTEFTAAPATIFGHRVRLQQALMNLILNGMEAMTDTPEADRRLLVRTATNGERRLEVSVTDSGPGIPLEKLPRLFDSFFTTKEDGMGLGLAIARSIIDAHRGRISAENNADGGATFRFDLPIGATAAG